MYINCTITSLTGIARIHTKHEVGPRRIDASTMRTTPFELIRSEAGDSIDIQAVRWDSLSIFQKKDVY